MLFVIQGCIDTKENTECACFQVVRSTWCVGTDKEQRKPRRTLSLSLGTLWVFLSTEDKNVTDDYWYTCGRCRKCTSILWTWPRRVRCGSLQKASSSSTHPWTCWLVLFPFELSLQLSLIWHWRFCVRVCVTDKQRRVYGAQEGAKHSGTGEELCHQHHGWDPHYEA